MLSHISKQPLPNVYIHFKSKFGNGVINAAIYFKQLLLYFILPVPAVDQFFAAAYQFMAGVSRQGGPVTFRYQALQAYGQVDDTDQFGGFVGVTLGVEQHFAD